MVVNKSTSLLILTAIFGFFSYKSAKKVVDSRNQAIESKAHIEICNSNIEKLLIEKKNYIENPKRKMWHIEDEINNQKIEISSNNFSINLNNKNFTFFLISFILLGLSALISLFGFVLLKKDEKFQI